MPRRHIISAAGALAAALLVAAQAPANAQTAPGQPSRATPGAGQDQAAGTADSLGGWESTTIPEPLGGMGDEPPEAPSRALGGLGDEPSEAALQPEEESRDLLQPEETGIPVKALGLSPPPTGQSALGQINTALLPEPHDLDPFAPLGIRLGSFLLFPELEVGADLTNNVLDTKFDTRTDWGPEIKPRVRLDSDWGRHYLGFEANADRLWYTEFPIADTKNYQVLARGRLDVLSRTNLSAEIEKSHIQENSSAITLTDIVNANTALDEQHATATLDHTFNRLNLKFTGTVADYDYARRHGRGSERTECHWPISTTTATRWARCAAPMNSSRAGPGSSRPRSTSGSTRSRSAYRAFRRGSTGFVTQAGVNLRLNGTIFGEIAGGWGEQQPIEVSLDTIKGPVINGDLIWMPTPMTKLEFLARTEINETSFEDSAGAIDHFFELSLQHAFLRYLVLGVYGSYEVADFASDPQIDRRTKFGATGQYYFNPTMSVYAQLRAYRLHQHRSRQRFQRGRVLAGAEVQAVTPSDQLLDLSFESCGDVRPGQRVGDVGG